MKFSFNIFKGRTDLVGVAIGDAHVRAVQLARASSGCKVTGYAEAVLPKTIFDISGGVDSEGLSKVFEKLFVKPSEGVFTTRDVAINLPESRCFVRLIHVTPMSDAELDEAVIFEAESYIPVPIDQVYLDWQRVEEVNGRLAILLMASPKVFVDKVLEAVSKAGLVCRVVEVESQGIARAIMPVGDKTSALIVDIKAVGTDLVMVEHESIQFTSTILIAGNNFTQAISQGLDVSEKRAEEIKIEAGFGNTEEYPNLKTLLMPVMNSWLLELNKVLLFHDQHSTDKIDRIILVGGAASTKNLVDHVKSSITDRPDLKIVLGDPTVNMKIELPKALEGEKLLSWVAAVGLAMKGMEE